MMVEYLSPRSNGMHVMSCHLYFNSKYHTPFKKNIHGMMLLNELVNELIIEKCI